ncbi:MAG: DUF370 domain-containing protein [Oscillospiraceae bacterium]|nr:DUF370 domain-containing protein [Oscillospiraceae bacterium]
MYLHLGQNVVVRTATVIGIFDIENTSMSKLTRHYLAQAEKNGRVINVSMELPKSFIVCEEDQKIVVYISQISPATLRKRTGFLAEIANL